MSVVLGRWLQRRIKETEGLTPVVQGAPARKAVFQALSWATAPTLEEDTRFMALQGSPGLQVAVAVTATLIRQATRRWVVAARMQPCRRPVHLVVAMPAVEEAQAESSPQG